MDRSSRDIFEDNVDNTSEFVAVLTKKTITRRIRVCNKEDYSGTNSKVGRSRQPAAAGRFAPFCNGVIRRGPSRWSQDPTTLKRRFFQVVLKTIYLLVLSAVKAD